MVKIVKFKTGTLSGFFVSVPSNTILDSCHFKDKEGMPFALMIGTGRDFASSYHPIVMKSGGYEIIGFSHKITEDQITEKFSMSFNQYINWLSDNEITVNFSDNSDIWMILLENQPKGNAKYLGKIKEHPAYFIGAENGIEDIDCPPDEGEIPDQAWADQPTPYDN